MARRNFLFTGSPRGGERLAAAFTLVDNCLALGVAPYGYLVDVIRKVQAKGGVVIANSYPGTRTVHRENVLYCIESASGDAQLARLHLVPGVIALGNHTRSGVS